MSMENGPKPENGEFSLKAVLEMAKDPTRREQARLALLQRKEELERALHDVENAIEKPGRKISEAEWQGESSRLKDEIGKLVATIAEVDSL